MRWFFLLVGWVDYRFGFCPWCSDSAINFWCGNNGFLGAEHPDARLYDEPPERAVHCAVCEGKATGAGLNGAREIAGRPVLFKPRF